MLRGAEVGSVWWAPGFGTVVAVGWVAGEKTIDFLLERGRLERVAVGVEAACGALLERAAKRLATARAAIAGEGWEGAFANAYDVYRMAAEVLLLRQGLRATGGDGPMSRWRMRCPVSSPVRSRGSRRCGSNGCVRGGTRPSTSIRPVRRRRMMTLGGLSIWLPGSWR